MITAIQGGGRIVLGLIYLVFGGMGLAMAMGLMHMPEPAMPEKAMAFTKGIMGSGYFMWLLKGTETLCGLLLLINRAAPLALVILAPVTLNIFLFHFYLTPGINNSILPLVMVAAHVLAMTAYGKVYKPLFLK